MLLPAATVQWVAVGGAAAAVLGLGTAAAAVVRLSRLRRAYAALAGDAQTGDVIDAVQAHLAQVQALRADVGALDGQVRQLRSDIADALRHVAVVRYDAFADMGGRMSYSAALLDDAGDGLVLTAINGRSETRTYAKGVKGGDSDHALSPEETQAVGYALRGVAAARRRRGSRAAAGAAEPGGAGDRPDTAARGGGRDPDDAGDAADLDYPATVDLDPLTAQPLVAGPLTGAGSEPVPGRGRHGRRR